MPNYVTTRVTIKGSRADLLRFEAECIRVSAETPEEGVILDFNVLVPTPADVQALGYSGEAAWSTAHWGTKWNSMAFSGSFIDETIYDLIFDTAWSCPEKAITALASRYPTLSGTVVFIEPAHSECIFGEFRDGSYSSAHAIYGDEEDDEEDESTVAKLVYGANGCDCHRRTSAQALIASLERCKPLSEYSNAFLRISEVYGIAEDLEPICTSFWC